MLSFSGSLKVFVAVQACDRRKGFNGLHGLVTERLKHPSVIWNPDMGGPSKAISGPAPGQRGTCFSAGKPDVPPRAWTA